ncbi:MAG: formylglycine-generating enzyme family protein [Chitinophagales bacterium]|nr:formylglycine-generating enzyme family protein [Chitinophagales bacterium]
MRKKYHLSNIPMLAFCLVFLFSCNIQHKNDASTSSPQIYKKTDGYIVKDTVIKGFKFVFIPKGTYTFGMNDALKTIDYDYWIMKFEVTNEQYAHFLNDALANKRIMLNSDTVVYAYPGDRIRPKGVYHAMIPDGKIRYINGHFLVDSGFEQHPVTCLTWFGCRAFCDYSGFQLPDQYEWEKAARGATGWNYPWGDTLDFRCANYHFSKDPFSEGTTPVGFYNGQQYQGFQTIDSPSPYGCYDMAGNAWEVTNSTIYPDRGFIEGGGGGYLYHTGAMTQSWFRSRFGYPIPSRIDRAFISDGFRCIVK